MKRNLFLVFLLCSMAIVPISILYASGGWNKGEDERLANFEKKVKYIEKNIEKKRWKYVERDLKYSKLSYLDYWERKGLSDHPSVKEAQKTYDRLQKALANKDSGKESNAGKTTHPKTPVSKPWGKSEEGTLKTFTRSLKYAEKKMDSPRKSDQKMVASYLKRLEGFLEALKKKGHENHPKYQEARGNLNTFKEKWAKKSGESGNTGKAVSTPPSGDGLYLSMKGGDINNPGTRDKPAKYLWHRLRSLGSGAKLHLSGDFYGPMGGGKIEITQSGLSLRGGYSDDFSQWDPVKFPTVFHPLKKAKDKNEDLNRKMVLVENKKNHLQSITIEGMVFDQQRHTQYGSDGNMNRNLTGTLRTPIVTITFTDEVIIRNCVFVNGSLGGLRLNGRSSKARAVIENCLFINCVLFGVELLGVQAEISNCTFALIQPMMTQYGHCISVGARGSLVAKNNIFAYSEVGVKSLRSNSNISLIDNEAHCITRAFVYFSEKSHSMKFGFGKDEMEQLQLLMKAPLSGNRKADPQLNLDPQTLLKFLKNKSLYKKEISSLLEGEIRKAESRLGKGETNLQEKKEPASKKAKKTEEEEENPFGEGIKKDEKKKEEKKTPADTSGKDQKTAGVPDGDYYAPAYPLQRVWIFPQNSEGKAGAKRPQAQ